MLWRPMAIICLLLIGLALPPNTTAQPPAGFTAEVVPGLGNIAQPTAFAFLPNGDMLIASKPGRLFLYEQASTTLRQTPVFDLVSDICDTSERGLLGVAIDPAFATNRHVYVYYTFDKFNTKETPAPDCDFNTSLDPVNRVSRLTLSAGLTTAEEFVLLDNIPSPNGNHNAGDLQFGKDGYLYIATGDGGRNNTARQRYNLDGAILRITGAGTIPQDNPYTGAGTARCYDPAPNGNKDGFVASNLNCQELFAFGLRNPYRIAFDPNATDTRFFINDVGQNNAEEISLGAPGADYGWNCYEGTLERRQACNPLPQGTIAPYFEYQRPAPQGQPAFFNGCASITGGAFVPAGAWPSEYDGVYLFGDFVCGRIFALRPGGGSPTPSLFLSGFVPTHMAFGPLDGEQALYFANYGGNSIHYVLYTGSTNRSPRAALTATPTRGRAPLTVNFSGAESTDPDSGDQITAYLWNFGNGATTETTGPTVSYTYTVDGVYNTSLRVRDSRGSLSTAATLRIDVGNTPPAAQITAPGPDTFFRVGERITLSGTATDTQDGLLTGSALSWEVRRHHADHWHPYHNATGAVTSLTAPAPEDFDAVNNSYLEVRLSATDRDGLTTVVTRTIRPHIVSLTMRTEPNGLQVRIDDGVAARTLTASATLQVWSGQPLSLSAPAGQSASGTQLQLCGWRHGGVGAQSYSAPLTSGSLRAVFAPTNTACPAAASQATTYLPLVSRLAPR